MPFENVNGYLLNIKGKKTNVHIDNIKSKVDFADIEKKLAIFRAKNDSFVRDLGLEIFHIAAIAAWQDKGIFQENDEIYSYYGKDVLPGWAGFVLMRNGRMVASFATMRS